jgi:UDP-glucuronate 4-epimerase
VKYLVTGSAGFIGFHLSGRMLEEGLEVVGIDNLNSYYDVNLKQSRLDKLQQYKTFRFEKCDMAEMKELAVMFDSVKPDVVVNLAAQPGVRYSITNPDVSMRNNVSAFFNLLECCKQYGVKSLIYASSSSVYGNSTKMPFSVDDNVDHPISLYAATKKANELMAYTYHHLYGMHVTGLRFFTVYGPWGRPDMAYFKFAERIFHGLPIEVYNNGDMMRDFTYIDDVVESMIRLIRDVKPEGYRLLNIGGEHPVNLLEFIETLESKIGKKSEKIFKEMQPGDVKITCADSSELARLTGYKPQTRIDEGLGRFVDWYKGYYKVS